VYGFAEQCDSDITDSRATFVSKKVLERGKHDDGRKLAYVSKCTVTCVF
jgi:hypothetical protein